MPNVVVWTRYPPQVQALEICSQLVVLLGSSWGDIARLEEGHCWVHWFWEFKASCHFLFALSAHPYNKRWDLSTSCCRHMLPCLPINTDSFWNCNSNSSFYNLPLVKVFYHSNRKVTKYLISIVIYQAHVKIPWVKRVTNGNIYKVSVYRV